VHHCPFAPQIGHRGPLEDLRVVDFDRFFFYSFVFGFVFGFDGSFVVSCGGV
jgi:hypothetical protein